MGTSELNYDFYPSSITPICKSADERVLVSRSVIKLFVVTQLLLVIALGVSFYLLYSSRASLTLEHQRSSARIATTEVNIRRIAQILKFVLHPDEDDPAKWGKKDVAATVTVTAPRANLRREPSKSSSVLMSLQANSSLVVENEIEEWYQVSIPTGEKAWIAKNMVSPVSKG